MDRFIRPTVVELSEEDYEKFMDWLNSPTENKKAKELMELASSEVNEDVE